MWNGKYGTWFIFLFFYLVDDCLSMSVSVYLFLFCVQCSIAWFILNGCNTTNLYLPYSALLHIQSPSTIFRVPLPLLVPISPSEPDIFAFVRVSFHRRRKENNHRCISNAPLKQINLNCETKKLSIFTTQKKYVFFSLVVFDFRSMSFHWFINLITETKF